MSRSTGAVSLLGALVLVLVAALVAALTGALLTGVQMLLRGIDFATASSSIAADPLLMSLCQLLGLSTATAMGTLATFGDEVVFREALGLRAVPTAIVMLALTAGFAMQFPLHEVANLLGDLVPGFAVDPATAARMMGAIRIDGWLTAITVPLAVVAIPAISEELLFRGLLLPGLERYYGPRLALWTSSLAFGFIHLMPVAVVYASLAGLVLGWVRQRTDSLLPCIALHGAFNAVPILLSPRVVRIDGFNTVTESITHLPLALVLGSALVAAASLLTLGRLCDDNNS
ncbi:MAG: lysostaphin resistance A-like protein [Sandaracinaceae bacterium]